MHKMMLPVVVLVLILTATSTYATPLPPIPAYVCINVVDSITEENVSDYETTFLEYSYANKTFLNRSTVLKELYGPQKISVLLAPKEYVTEASISVRKNGYENDEIIAFNNSYYWSKFDAGEECIINHTFYMKRTETNGNNIAIIILFTVIAIALICAKLFFHKSKPAKPFKHNP